MIRTILLPLFLVFSIFAPLREVGAQTAEGAEMPWATAGVGGVHLLVEPGPLNIRVYKRDLHPTRNARSNLQATLYGPDRERLESVTIPASGGTAGEKGPVQTADLRTVVERPGLFLLEIVVPGDRYGVNTEWAIETNADKWVVELGRGHRDDRHREPIVMDSDKPAEITFLPRSGAFEIEAEALPPGSGPLRLYDDAGSLVAEIPVADERSTAIREYMRAPRPSRPEASVRFKVPASENRGQNPWRLQIPQARVVLEIDGVTRWERGDLYPDQAVWTPVADSWFPFTENRWMVTPYQRTIYAAPRETGTLAFTIHNNSPRPRDFDLSLEFPGQRWDARLEKNVVSLKAGESQEVSIRYVPQGRGREQVVHLRARPRENSAVSTYATLRLHVDEAPAEKPLDLPHALRPYVHENGQYGYLPEYPVGNQVYFDQNNNGFVLERRWLRREVGNSWVTTDLRRAVVKTVPETETGNWSGIGTKVAFDAANNVYLLASAGRTVALLRSTDHGETFTAHIIEGRENESRSWDLEQFSGHNSPEEPPAVVRLTRTSGRGGVAPGRLPQNLRWRSTNDVELIVAEKTENGSIAFHEPVKLTSLALGLSLHSGIPSMVVSRGDKIHVVWGEATDPAASAEEVPGVPAYVASYDRKTRTAGEPVFMSFGPPANDGHNTPSITMDGKGYLHVVVGTHGRPFQYLHSLASNDAYSGWTEAVRTSDENLRQTYVGLVCDDEDNLHLVFRLWRTGEEHLNGATWAALAHQRKPAGEDWEAPQVLVAAALPDYSVYYHRLTVDRKGELYLNYDYWSTSWFYRNDTGGPVAAGSGREGTGWGRSVMTSPDNGETWKLW